jgi:DNA-directed RNA polymerase subunit RPC12/RpoP
VSQRTQKKTDSGIHLTIFIPKKNLMLIVSNTGFRAFGCRQQKKTLDKFGKKSILLKMYKCYNCGKIIESKESVYKEKGKILCNICHIKLLEESIDSKEPEVAEVTPPRAKNLKFMITLIFGVILIISEILLLSGKSGGKEPPGIPEKKEGSEKTGSIVTRMFFINELLITYKVKYGDFPETLSQLSPEFIEPEIKDESIVYEKKQDIGFILYTRDSEGRAIPPVLSGRGEIALAELKNLSD